MLDFLFGATLPTHLVALDAKDDEEIDIADPIFTLRPPFSGGPSPSASVPGCGLDPTEGGLACASVAVCP